jgi:hypothetical protein
VGAVYGEANQEEQTQSDTEARCGDASALNSSTIAKNRLDHVTLTPGAAALAVAADTLWVRFRPQASSPHRSDGRPAQVVDVTLRRRFVPLATLKLGDGVRSRSCELRSGRNRPLPQARYPGR